VRLGSSLEPKIRQTADDSRIAAKPSREKDYAFTLSAAAPVRCDFRARRYSDLWPELGKRRVPMCLHERQRRSRLLELD
jgi:hypothetical protein